VQGLALLLKDNRNASPRPFKSDRCHQQNCQQGTKPTVLLGMLGYLDNPELTDASFDGDYFEKTLA
jgi:hypothetical protein